MVLNPRPDNYALPGFQPVWELPRCDLKLAAIYTGRGRLKKKAEHSRSVDGRFESKGTYLEDLSWAAAR